MKLNIDDQNTDKLHFTEDSIKMSWRLCWEMLQRG